MIEYRVGNDLDLDQVIELYRASTLGERRPVDDRERMRGMLRNANLVITAWDGDLLVGISRSLTDFVYVTYLSDLAVRESYQRQGIGKRLLAAVAQELDGKGCFCIPYAHLVGFYGGIGFHVMEPAKAPTFLRLRLEKYRDRGDGNDYLIMRREGVASF